ncbi:class I SAM-dependent methyltransferase [Azospirillum rugosum]|uniref:SAM-dependent methyltransferase n=1 Tax=Azospirillum rugosum TaxID=416170 RepID=A0ABS4SCP4_9PROT|nr:class I SAM-dependent methyltransferase [Azospirillum rugosum]MBP2290338.1 SAM-dependent methyltransferase [Azospirillum rugosum]MDQ0527814.1 SAM-dependent methyltransferase [Azospirillum rugosum]
MSIEQQVAEHYGRSDLASDILGALERAGKDIDRLRPEDLAAIDEFHIRGREATDELGQALGLEAGLAVLDVGSGLGGPSRRLADVHGCRIVGIDLTDEYCRTATVLAERVGLGGMVEYRQGSALDMPFPAASFDRVYTQHVAMNIADKPRLYAEIARVLKPGGLFGLYDLLQGPGGTVHFPVPWARDPATSFLATPDELRGLLADSGLEVVGWRDTSAEGRAWFQLLRERLASEGPPPIGFHLLLGPDFRDMARNQVRNLEEQRILPTEVICRRA